MTSGPQAGTRGDGQTVPGAANGLGGYHELSSIHELSIYPCC